jgi:ABC-2 type transport system permease protein
MNKIWVLTRVFIKNSSGSITKGKKSRLPKSLNMIIIMTVLMMSIGIPFGAFIGEGYELLQPMGQEGAILGFGISTVSIAIFVFGIFYVLTTFYFSRDIEFLLPLPVKSFHILTAKFITVIIYEYFTETVFLLPVLAAYGIKSSAGILYYIYSIIIFLTLPVIPLVLASAINMIIMRFTNLGKHKDALRVGGGIVAMAFAIGFNMLMQKNAATANNPQQMLKIFTEGKNSLVGLTAKVFPSAKLAAWSLIENNSLKGIVNLMIFLLVTAAFIGIFMTLAEMLYFRGVVGVSESYSKNKKYTSAELQKNLVQSSALKTYTMKELKLLFRTPAYFLNCVLMNFLWPVFLLLPALGQPELFTALKNSGDFLSNSRTLGIIIAGAFGIGMFMAGSTGISATAISREGQNLFVGKYLPMRYRDQLMAKVLSGIMLNLIGIIVALGVVSVIVKLPLYLIVLVAISATLGTILIGFTGIFIDLNFPKLTWDNEQKAVKQNFNLMINMFLAMLLAATVVFITIRLKLGLVEAFAGIAGVSGVINIILYYMLGTYGEKLYSKIEA